MKRLLFLGAALFLILLGVLFDRLITKDIDMPRPTGPTIIRASQIPRLEQLPSEPFLIQVGAEEWEQALGEIEVTKEPLPELEPVLVSIPDPDGPIFEVSCSEHCPKVCRTYPNWDFVLCWCECEKEGGEISQPPPVPECRLVRSDRGFMWCTGACDPGLTCLLSLGPRTVGCRCIPRQELLPAPVAAPRE